MRRMLLASREASTRRLIGSVPFDTGVVCGTTDGSRWANFVSARNHALVRRRKVRAFLVIGWKR
jgi:hypothetical protein